MGELQPDAGELTWIIFETRCLPVGRTSEILLYARELECVREKIQSVVPCADAPSVFPVDRLDIESILPSPQRINSSMGRRIYRVP